MKLAHVLIAALALAGRTAYCQEDDEPDYGGEDDYGGQGSSEIKHRPCFALSDMIANV